MKLVNNLCEKLNLDRKSLFTLALLNYELNNHKKNIKIDNHKSKEFVAFVSDYIYGLYDNIIEKYKVEKVQFFLNTLHALNKTVNEIIV